MGLPSAAAEGFLAMAESFIKPGPQFVSATVWHFTGGADVIAEKYSSCASSVGECNLATELCLGLLMS